MRSIGQGHLISLSLVLLALSPILSFADGGQTALVIIDMQPSFVTRGGNDKTPENQKKVRQIVQTQIEAIKAARAVNMPIIFIEYEGTAGNTFGDTYDDLKEATQGYFDVVYIKKNSDGMFETFNSHRQELVQYLTANNIQTLILAGANGGACVQSSIESALENNYNVIAYSKAIADFNYKEFIYPYNNYENIIPHCSDCTFKQTNDLSDIFFSSMFEPRPTCTPPNPTEEAMGQLNHFIRELIEHPAIKPTWKQLGESTK